MKGMLVVLAVVVLACVHVQADNVVAIHVSEWEQYKNKCNHSSSEYDPSIFPVGDLDDCNKYFDCAGSFMPMFHCPDGQNFNTKSKQCEDAANVSCLTSSN